MMPDLGKYSGAVLGSYAVALILIAGIIILSVWQSRRVKQALDDAEARVRNG
jgi:heme exporter protein D